MLSTGERYLPEIDGAVLSYEHWHRYLVATQFVAGKTVLDVAAGEGYGSALLARSAATVVGVDLDPEAVAVARAKYVQHNLTFECGSADSIPIPGHHLFDVIVSFETIEHLTAACQRRFAGEIKRLLKPDGLLLMSTPDRLIYTEKNQHQNPFHLQEFSTEEFAAFLGCYFSNVRLLCQRVYPCSYIWDTAETPTRWTEYQLELANGELQPVFADHKEKLYLLAVCGNEDTPSPGNSLLLDLDELATRGPSKHAQAFTSTLFVDTGEGFRADMRLGEKLPPGPVQFRLTFALGGLGPVRGLRWDPLELRTCRLRLDAVEWEDSHGATHALDLARVTTNGELRADGQIVFETLDPMVFLPLTGDVSQVMMAGWYEADDLPASMECVDAAVQNAKAQIRNRDEQLHNCDEQLRDRDERLRSRDEQLRDLDERLRGRDEQLRDLDERLRGRDEQLRDLDERLRNRDEQLRDRDEQLHNCDEQLRDRDEQLHNCDEQLRDLNERLRNRDEQLRDRDEQLRQMAEAQQREQQLTTTLFVDTGAGFWADQCVAQELPEPGHFQLCFALDDFGPVSNLRWDPLEMRTCRLRLDAVEWEDHHGVVHSLALAEVATTGELREDGLIAFETLDPMVFLPLGGDVSRVTITGWYEADDLNTSLNHVTAAVHIAQAHLRNRDEQLRDLDERLRERDEQLRERDEQLRLFAEARRREGRLTTALFLDSGAGFQADQCVAQELPGPGHFQLCFALDGLGPVRGLRWDLLEQRTCRLRLEAVEWEDQRGRTRALDLRSTVSNGERREDGLFLFETLDPMMFLPISGDIACVTIRGWYEADDLNTSLNRVDTAARTAKTQLRLCTEQLRLCEEQFQALTQTLEMARSLTSTLLADTKQASRSRAERPFSLRSQSGSA